MSCVWSTCVHLSMCVGAAPLLSCTAPLPSCHPAERGHIAGQSTSCTHAYVCVCVRTMQEHVHSHATRVHASLSYHLLSAADHNFSCRSSSRVVERPPRPPPSEWTLTDEMAHSSLPCFSSLCSPLWHPLHRRLVTLPPLVASHPRHLSSHRLWNPLFLASCRRHPARLLASSTSYSSARIH